MEYCDIISILKSQVIQRNKLRFEVSIGYETWKSWSTKDKRRLTAQLQFIHILISSLNKTWELRSHLVVKIVENETFFGFRDVLPLINSNIKMFLVTCFFFFDKVLNFIAWKKLKVKWEFEKAVTEITASQNKVTKITAWSISPRKLITCSV